GHRARGVARVPQGCGRSARAGAKVREGVRIRHRSSCAELSGLRADAQDSHCADASRVSGGAGGADGESFAQERAAHAMERGSEQGGVLSPKHRDLPALTGLRFFLALWVILHHLTGPGQELEAVALQLPHGVFSLIRGGYQAVTTFFVLSGFVLTRTYATVDWNPRALFHYATGRIARVYPVYLLSLAVMIPFLLGDRAPGKAGYVGAYVTLIQAWLGALPGGWDSPAGALSCGGFFLALFPLAALWARLATWRSVIGVAIGACLLTRVMWAAGVSDDIKPLVHLA